MLDKSIRALLTTKLIWTVDVSRQVEVSPLFKSFDVFTDFSVGNM